MANIPQCKPGNWVKRAPMPVIRSHFGTATWNGKIYLFGGGGETFKSLNRVDIYDPVADKWIEGSPMPTTRSGVAAVTLDDRIYVMGGGFKNPDGSFNFLTTVEVYDPGRDSWSKGTDLLMRHDAPAATALDRKIYLFGGHHPGAREGPLTDPATNFSEILDLGLGVWRGLLPMPTPRFSLSTVAMEGKIWVMGGGAYRDGVFKNYDLVEIYDTTARTWTRQTHLSLPWPSAGLGGCVLSGKIYVLGGNNGECIQKRVSCYDPGQKKWLELPAMNEARAAMGIVALEGTLFVLGGRGPNGGAPVKTIETLST